MTATDWIMNVYADIIEFPGVVRFSVTVLVLGIGELLVVKPFNLLKQYIGPVGGDVSARYRGVIERYLIVFGLILGYPQVLIAFSALKLGTRLYDDNKSDISNNYFLTGNLMSISIALIYTSILRGFYP